MQLEYWLMQAGERDSVADSVRFVERSRSSPACGEQAERLREMGRPVNVGVGYGMDSRQPWQCP